MIYFLFLSILSLDTIDAEINSLKYTLDNIKNKIEKNKKYISENLKEKKNFNIQNNYYLHIDECRDILNILKNSSLISYLEYYNACIKKTVK